MPGPTASTATGRPCPFLCAVPWCQKLEDLEADVRTTCGQQVRESAAVLLPAWQSYWSALLSSDLARILLLPNVEVPDLVMDGALAQAVEARQVKAAAFVGQINALSDDELAWTFRDLWNVNSSLQNDPCFRVISSALVSCRYFIVSLFRGPCFDTDFTGPTPSRFDRGCGLDHGQLASCGDGAGLHITRSSERALSAAGGGGAGSPS